MEEVSRLWDKNLDRFNARTRKCTHWLGHGVLDHYTDNRGTIRSSD